ncbi:MAG TPA: acyl-CoA dehydrogenase, partial [Desulfobacteraceae bacterium]|nr:acyl-CoA dehydrogenase [Desulfobacteraceae bacterium]
MEIINYTDQHKDFRIKARKFMEKEVIPNVEQWEKERLMPKSAWKKMGEAGFLC